MSGRISSKKKFELTQFGLTFALFFLIVHLLIRGGSTPYLFISLACMVVTILFYRILSPLNSAWLSLGEFMGRIVGSVILGFFFFALLTPLAFLKRRFAKEIMPLDASGDRKSFWEERETREISRKDLEHQF
jgi:hypothetical protein